MGKLRYSDHLDTLTAVVTHLAMGEHIKRTANGLAADTQIDEHGIATVLDGFPGLFKRYGKDTSPEGRVLYSLHLVHAGRHLLTDTRGDRVNPLDSQYLATLLEFISHRAQDEYQRATAVTSARIAALVSILGAVVSLFGPGLLRALQQ